MPKLKPYRPWYPDRVLLLPPDMRDWLPEGHLVYFLLDVAEQLDITSITDQVQAKDPRGVQPYDPLMMVVLLLYAYCTGRPSSRKIERATYEDVAFRVLADGQHPDHSTISDFRKVHLKALSCLFVQVLRLCQGAGLVKLGRVSLDGTKGKANASRYKAMSYQRMLKSEAELDTEIKRLLDAAEATDKEEDERHGKDKRGDELPDELRRRQDRLAAIRKARAELEREAASTRADELRKLAEQNRERAARADTPGKAAAAQRRADKEDEEASKLEAKAAGMVPPNEAPSSDDGPAVSSGDEGTAAPQAVDSSGSVVDPALIVSCPADESMERDAPATSEAGEDDTDDLPQHRVQATAEGLPTPKAQRNFTDPDSRILKKGKGYLQGYNCQAVVDADNQVIVAEALTNQPPDAEHLDPLLRRVESNCGKAPDKVSADAGYFSESNVRACEARGVDPYIAVRKQKDQERAEPVPGDEETCRPRETNETGEADDKKKASAREKMDAKLRTPEGKAEYAKRKHIVEPVFGQMRTCQGFNDFLLRGIEQARGEWSLYCTGHNLLKLFRAFRRGVEMPWTPTPTAATPALPTLTS